MPDPTNKSPAINSLIESVMGKDRRLTIMQGMCMTCGGSAGGFRDALSAKEYSISGMCQNCQDQVFAEPEDDEEDMG